MKIGIYKITSPSGKIYIGQSRNISKRWNNYKYLSCKNQTKLYNSFLKYGVEKHIFEILEICTEDILNSKEVEYVNKIPKYLSLNIREAGDGKRMSEESIKIIAEKHRKKITQFDRTGKFIKIWNSITEAAGGNKTLGTCISYALDKPDKTSLNSVWKRGEYLHDITVPIVVSTRKIKRKPKISIL